MSIYLVLLSILMVALSSLAIIRPAMLFQYPVAAGLLMLAFILPQAWQVEASGEGIDYDPPLGWSYMLLCMIMLIAGFIATSRAKRRKSLTPRHTLETFFATYREDRLFYACLTLVVIGAAAWLMMLRESVNFGHNEGWTGVITFYALLTSLLLYGSSLSWLVYLYNRDKRTLVLAVIGLSFSVPTVLFAAKRELAFELATSLLLGLFFVRNKSIGRAFLIPMILLAAVYVNQAGQIRQYIGVNNSSLVGALTSDEVTNISAERPTFEVMFALSDIAQTTWANDYAYITPYWNTLEHLYFPAFIFGRDAKNSYSFDLDIYAHSHAFQAENGATHTGFADSFIEFHFFGCVIFFLISAALGFYWRRAREGDIGAQFYYMVLLTEGMMTITESTARFVGKVPFLFGVMGLVFWYARRPKTSAAPDFTGAPQSPAAMLQRSQTRLQLDR